MLQRRVSKFVARTARNDRPVECEVRLEYPDITFTVDGQTKVFKW